MTRGEGHKLVGVVIVDHLEGVWHTPRRPGQPRGRTLPTRRVLRCWGRAKARVGGRGADDIGQDHGQIGDELAAINPRPDPCLLITLGIGHTLVQPGRRRHIKRDHLLTIGGLSFDNPVRPVMIGSGLDQRVDDAHPLVTHRRFETAR